MMMLIKFDSVCHVWLAHHSGMRWSLDRISPQEYPWPTILVTHTYFSYVIWNKHTKCRRTGLYLWDRSLLPNSGSWSSSLEITKFIVCNLRFSYILEWGYPKSISVCTEIQSLWIHIHVSVRCKGYVLWF